LLLRPDALNVENMTVTARTVIDHPRRAGAGRYLMCPPVYFGVEYRINPWMDPTGAVDAELAMRQWRQIEAAYRGAGHTVVTVAPAPGLPDMVFAANAGLVSGDRVLLSRFRHRERSAEEGAYAAAFRALGFAEVTPSSYVNEGEGDYLRVGGLVLGGSGFRTDPRAHDEVAEFLGAPVVALELVDERFYHLDTALAVLRHDLVAYWPPAFSPRSVGVLQDMFPDAVVASEADAMAFGLNACSDGDTVVLSSAATGLIGALRERGLATVCVDTSELQKAGGSVKCCTLELPC
jgi:N-dimethylarginine dimethylaminohydrolase